MPNPQQPELRRSERVPALDPDASEAKLSAQRRNRRRPTAPNTPVPDDQQPGHHPDHDQDKPDLDAFAERLGVVAEEDEPADAPHVEDTEPSAASTPSPTATKTRTGSRRPNWSPIGLMLVGPVTGILAVKGVLKALKRFGR